MVSAKRKGPARGNCKFGFIKRAGYSFKRKSGKRVTVKASCIKEQGKAGAGRDSIRKIKVIPSLKKGMLTQHGYKVKSPAKVRHTALRKAVAKSGSGKVIKRLNVLGVYNKFKNPSITKVAKSDMEFVRSLKANN